MNCNGCYREIEVGERFIVDSVSGFLKTEADETVDGIVSEILGSDDGQIRYCEDCTEPGGDYLWETNYGDPVADTQRKACVATHNFPPDTGVGDSCYCGKVAK